MAQTPIPRPEAAWALLQQDRFADAIATADAVLARAPANVSALACRGMARWRMAGVNPQSLADLERAIALAPAESAIRHNYGMVLTDAGRIEDAATQYRAALALKPTDTMAFWGLSLNKRFAEEDDLVRSMVALGNSGNLTRLERDFLSFALAKVYDDLDDPERAMRYAREGNDLQSRPWDLAGEARRVEEIRAHAAADAFRTMPTSRHPSRAPLFIVGMPRSGTTLVETMLSRHPDVLALGESPQIPRLLTALQQRGTSPNRDWLAARAEELVRSWTARAEGRPFRIVTDKVPENSQNLGFIRQLFPKARVIHVRRHPLDVGVSNYFQRYGLGQGFSNRLDWLGLRTGQVADAMAAWKSSLDLEILDIWYERLVANPRAEIARVAEFAGLSWHDALLTPEQSMRAVGTASQWQVRQPIYTRSAGRWRRYEPWLGPMIDAMGGMDWIEAQMAEMDESPR